MPDAPAIPPPTGLYPQPPSQPGLVSNPAQVLDLIGSIARNVQFQRDLRAREAIGQAYQNALQPDGTIDRQKLRAGLSDPAASWLLPDAMTHVLNQQAAQFDLAVNQNKFILDRLGSLADNPKVSPEDVYHFVADAARAGIPPAVLTGWQQAVLNNPRGISYALKSARSQAIGSAGLAVRDTGPPAPGTGAPTTISRGQSIWTGPEGMPIGQAPGEAEIQAASAGRASQLQATGGTSAQYHADLENLKHESNVLDNLGGPTIDVEKKLNALTQRLGGFGITMTPEQLRAADSFDKIANQISLNQSKLFPGSDAGLHTVIAANPNLGMSRYSREGVIDMLQGNQDAVDTLRKLWFDARAKGAPAHFYDQFAHEASKVIDPRVFQFNRLNRENQQRFWDQLDPADIPDFKAKYQEAVRRGWVKPPKGQKSSSISFPMMG